MKRTTIFLDEGAERALQALAKRRRRPMASIVREAIERYLVEDSAPSGARLGFIAAGRSGHADTADRHEELLFDDSCSYGAPGASARRRAPGAPRTASPPRRARSRR